MPLFRFTLESDLHAFDLGSLDLPTTHSLVQIGVRIVVRILANIAILDGEDGNVFIRATDENGHTKYKFSVPAGSHRSSESRLTLH